MHRITFSEIISLDWVDCPNCCLYNYRNIHPQRTLGLVVHKKEILLEVGKDQ